VIGGDWGFTARERRPPPDPASAMLSFGSTLLVHEAVTALAAAALDPPAGFLHQARWGRPSLAPGLMEEDRPLVVDAVVLRCLTTGIVRPGDFETIPEHGCRMSPRARQAFLAACERRMLTLFSHGPSARRMSCRGRTRPAGQDTGPHHPRPGPALPARPVEVSDRPEEQ